jgi:hypothetical protein
VAVLFPRRVTWCLRLPLTPGLRRGQAPLRVRAHLVQRRLVRAFDLLAVGAGAGAGVDVGGARSVILPLTPTLSP